MLSQTYAQTNGSNTVHWRAVKLVMSLSYRLYLASNIHILNKMRIKQSIDYLQYFIMRILSFPRLHRALRDRAVNLKPPNEAPKKRYQFCFVYLITLPVNNSILRVVVSFFIVSRSKWLISR